MQTTKRLFITAMIGLILVATCVFGLTLRHKGSMFALVPAFPDVPATHWACSSISNMYSLGIIKGYEDGTFHPSGNITNGEFIAMLVNTYCQLTDTPYPTASTPWYETYTDFAIEAGFVSQSKYPGTENNLMTRRDMAMWISNALPCIPRPSLDEAQRINAEKFIDASTIEVEQGYYQQVIAKIANIYIIVGDEHRRYNLSNNATRAEASATLTRYMERFTSCTSPCGDGCNCGCGSTIIPVTTPQTTPSQTPASTPTPASSTITRPNYSSGSSASSNKHTPFTVVIRYNINGGTGRALRS